MLSESTAQGLAAVVSFNFNMFELIAIMKVAAVVLGWKQTGTFYRFVAAVLTPFLKPIEGLLALVGKKSETDIVAAVILLMILIPVERIIVFNLTSQ
ncbi:MAG: hypothetical protein AB7T49_08755 [Oligoflexales bacterium]